jgi:hypothetical protein
MFKRRGNFFSINKTALPLVYLILKIGIIAAKCIVGIYLLFMVVKEIKFTFF